MPRVCRFLLARKITCLRMPDASAIVAPYKNAQEKVIGAIGIIGPVRMNYAHLIPMVDYTAKVVGRLLVE